MSASDLAATLRRLAGFASAAPWSVEVEGGDASVWAEPAWVNGEPEDRPVGDVWERDNAQFIVWCANNAEALATALERGAAAERVVEAARPNADARRADLLDAPAAYDALTEEAEHG